jgi:hypothetical protein
MSIGTRLTILDPTADATLESATLSPRLDTLNGKVVGLYSNEKPKATELLELVGGILSEQFQLRGIVRGTYNGLRVMRPDQWVDVHKCDAIVLTHGD